MHFTEKWVSKVERPKRQLIRMLKACPPVTWELDLRWHDKFASLSLMFLDLKFTVVTYYLKLVL